MKYNAIIVTRESVEVEAKNKDEALKIIRQNFNIFESDYTEVIFPEEGKFRELDIKEEE